jgi:hypothetical protein
MIKCTIILEYAWLMAVYDNIKSSKTIVKKSLIYIHTYITSRPLPFGVGRDHFFPLATHLSLLLLSSNST